MPWKINFFKSQPSSVLIGDAWFAPQWLSRKAADGKPFLGPEYYRDWFGKRDPIYVCLPGFHFFCVDTRVSDLTRYAGWTVTGDLPNITVYPSINLEGSYHGWIKNGEISEDVDGRIFSLDGMSRVQGKEKK